MDFKLMTDEEGEPKCCECCQYIAPLAEIQDMTGLVNRTSHFFCEVCSSTEISKTVNYSHLFADVKLTQSLGWIANKIIDEIRKQQPRTSDQS